MADININNNDYVEFIIKTPYGKSRKVSKGPGGWDNEGLELDRHKTYHGIMTEFVEALTFYDEDADYLYDAFIAGGINVDCYLLKRTRREVDGEVKFVDDYFGIADFKKHKRGENYIKLNFNSHNLEEIIKTHESDAFEMERLTSIDDKELDEAVINRIGIEGRTLYSSGSSKMRPNGIGGAVLGQPTCNFNLNAGALATCQTVLIAKGPERHSSVDAIPITKSNHNDLFQATYDWATVSNSFFPNVQANDGETKLQIYYNIEFTSQRAWGFQPSTIEVFIGRFKYNSGANNYKLTEYIPLYSSSLSNNKLWNIFSGNVEIDNVKYDEALILGFHNKVVNPNNWESIATINIGKQIIKLNSISSYEASPNLRFMFVGDIYKRLLQIMTGRKNAFYSKFFGKVEDGYERDGDGGLIGVISGFWVRAFDKVSDKYKSLTISLKDLFDSTDAMFNLGATVEINGFEERFRVEEKKFFYQNRVVITLPYVVEEEGEIDEKMYFSSIEVGFEKGGDYDSEIGLDEPNLKSNYITPIRKSKANYVKISKIRGDETGLEQTRRKPQFDYPEEDTSGDDSNWFLDIKRGLGSSFIQKIWSDRLQEIPEGIHDPTNFKSFLFTPFRMLKRHGYIITSGMLPYKNKFIKYINSKGNINLKTWFIGEPRAFGENEQNLMVNELSAPIMTPHIVKFKHPLDQDLIDEIKSKTEVMYQGSLEEVPNTFLKFRWKNTKGEIRTGYMLNIKLKSEGEFTMQIANENII